MNISFTGTITGEKLDLFLSTKVDVLFAMGTSVLEGTAIKLPSVIIPNNAVPFNRDKYVYLQNTKKYCLGWSDTQLDDLDLNTVSLKQIIDDIYLNNEKTELGESVYNYFINNHVIDHAIINLNNLLTRYLLLIKILRISLINYIRNRKDGKCWDYLLLHCIEIIISEYIYFIIFHFFITNIPKKY